MNKLFALLLPACIFYTSAHAQTPKRHKIAIFTPLYLDSAFDATGTYRYERTNPRFINAGLDFYLGAQMAADSLERRAAPLDVYILDSKAHEPVSQQLNRPELKDVEMIIAESNASETKIFAETAERKKIPFISATLPNDAGVTNNPYMVILNSTLQTHVEGIYQFLQKYHRSDRIIVFRKSGTQEDQIRNYLTDFSRTTTSAPLNIKFVDVGSDFSARSLAAQLDSTKKNICIAGSLDENFGYQLTQELATLTSAYPLSVIGMPTWDNMNFAKSQFNNLEVIYSTPFFYNFNSTLENQLSAEYINKMTNKPSDMFYRGYEAMLRFGLLLLETQKDVASNLTRKGNTILTQFDIEPVFKDKSSMTLDYFENKHLYFIRVLGGVKNIIF
jgi:hypothetical protein